MTTTLITGGTVVNATGRSRGRRADRRRDDRRGARARLDAARLRPRARTSTRVIDATGKYVIPGGIDAHTHMEMPFGGTEASRHLRDRHPRRGLGRHDDDHRLRRADHGHAASQDGLATWHEKAAGNCAIDYGFHQIMGDVDEDSLHGDGRAASTRASRASSCSWPTRASSTRTTARSCGRCRRPRDIGAADDDARRERPGDRRARRSSSSSAGKTDAVLPRHRARLADGGGGDAPRDHAREPHRRPALRRARLARSRPSSRSPAARDKRPERVRRDLPAVPLPLARGAARRDRARSGATSRAPSGCARRRCARREEGHQDHMWQALRTNDLQMVSTDHCPFCMKGQKDLGRRRLPQDPERHRLDRAPHGPDVPGRRHRRDHPGALGRADHHDPGAHVRHVRQEGRDPARRRRRHRRLRPERPHLDRPRARPTT